MIQNFYEILYKRQVHRDREEIGGRQMLGRKWRLIINDHEGSYWGDEHAQKLDDGVGHTTQ